MLAFVRLGCGPRRYIHTVRTSTLAFIVTLAASPLRDSAPDRSSNVIAVTARRGAVRPDPPWCAWARRRRRPTLDEATTDVARRMTAVLERVKALGVGASDIATVRYLVEPIQPPRGPDATDSTRIVAYRVSNVVQLKVRDVSAAARVVDAAVAAGANVVLGVSFTLEDRTGAEAAARQQAAAAHRTAVELARAALCAPRRLAVAQLGHTSRRSQKGFAVAHRPSAGPIEVATADHHRHRRALRHR